MRCLSPWSIGFVSALVPTLGAAAEKGLPRPAVPAGFGVNIHFTDPGPGEMARFAEAGYAMVRMDFAWGAVERERGRYDYAAYDRLMAQLRKVGARPIFILDYGNRLYDRGESPRTEAARSAFANYAATAARHFRGQGVIWEIWNEPNISQFWKPTPDPSAYARLAIETARAVRAADPDAVIVAPGSSTFPWAFLETIFAAGLLEHIDAVSVHPYRESSPETASTDYGRLRALMARYAPPEKRMMPIISSEWGYSTAEGAVTETRQAHYLARQWLANLASGVNLSIFYDWRDDGDDPHDREARFGTVRRNLEPKPSFLAAQKLIHTLRGFTLRHRLEGSSPSSWKLLFENSQKAGDLMLVEWSADPKSSDSQQAPRFRPVAADSSDSRALRRLASIRFTPGPVAEKQGYAATLPITIANTVSEPATIQVSARQADGSPPTASSFRLKPGECANRRLALPSREGNHVEHRTVRLQFTWNDEALAAVSPLDVWRADPIRLTEAPRAQGLVVTVENPSKQQIKGTLAVRTDRAQARGAVVEVTRGHDQARFGFPPVSALHQLLLTDDLGTPIAGTPPSRFEAMTGFPDRSGTSTRFDAVLFLDNVAESPRRLAAIAAGDDAPAAAALEVSYHFDPGWRYLAVSPQQPLAIPAAARGAIIWVRGNQSGDAVRCRFHDATGQTFQVDLARLDWSDWRPLHIDFSAASGAGHWGGANDGIPHRPIDWEALLLIDSSRSTHPQPQTILAASPYYVMDH
jgi:hypothetical protein